MMHEAKEREAIARIIDPNSWSHRDDILKEGRGFRHAMVADQVVDDSLTKADAILAALSPSAKAGTDGEVERADVMRQLRACGHGGDLYQRAYSCIRDMEADLQSYRATMDRIAELPTHSPEGLVEAQWRPIEQEMQRKGLRRSPKYYPAIGETCRMSGPNCDDADGYTWSEVAVLWRDDLFIVTRVNGCWPTVTKLELALFEPLDAITEGPAK